MQWFRNDLVPQLRQGEWWKHLLLDILVAILFVAIIIAIIAIPPYLFHPGVRIALATVLLVYLIIVIFLAQKSTRVAILATVLACLAFDFFLLDPVFSLWLAHAQDALDLSVFLVVASLVCWIFAQHGKLVKQTNQLKELEGIRFEQRLQEQRTEVNRRDDEFRAVYEVIMYVTREQKDLKEQLKQMAQTIADTFYFCGIRGCAFYLFDHEGDASMWVLSSRGSDMPKIAPGDEASVPWVMQHGQSVTLPDLPLVSHTKSSYLRRVVINNTSIEPYENKCNYLIPLTSGEKTIAVMRLYVQESAHVELTAIKSILRGETISTGIHSELFSKLLEQTVFMIEQSLIERALNLRQELQRRAEELHTAFISSVSHDFHTPLTQIMGAASGLLNRARPWEDEDACRESLQNIVGEAERLERIVGKMLALTRIEYGAFTLKKELYPIETIILNALNQGHMRSLKQGRRIEILVPDEVSAVELDPDLIGQVFTNLIENAIRYTPAESPIEISVRADDKHLFITVADYGLGIPDDALELVFERFRRIKQGVPDNATLTAEQGSGLGLAVCRGFVQAHGGRIWAENCNNGGAKFIFTLPLQTAEGVIREKNSAG
jgi:two-component system sensor histidine kinase KdpD